jgi:hypothetical protein
MDRGRHTSIALRSPDLRSALLNLRGEDGKHDERVHAEDNPRNRNAATRGTCAYTTESHDAQDGGDQSKNESDHKRVHIAAREHCGKDAEYQRDRRGCVASSCLGCRRRTALADHDTSIPLANVPMSLRVRGKQQAESRATDWLMDDPFRSKTCCASFAGWQRRRTHEPAT